MPSASSTSVPDDPANVGEAAVGEALGYGDILEIAVCAVEVAAADRLAEIGVRLNVEIDGVGELLAEIVED
jgi:hypothetical protein